MNKTDFIIGIDPGSKGGIAVLRKDGDIAWLLPYTDANMVNIVNIFENGIGDQYTEAYIEQVHSMPHDSHKAAFTFGRNFGFVLGALESRYIPIHFVSPQTWQKEFDIHSKEDSIATAKKLFPEVDLKPTQRCKKDSDGMSDSLLICEYGRRK